MLLDHQREDYLTILSEQYPTEQSLYTEIINLRAILNLPKGTEHFMSDLHGEYEAFCHILNNCSGVIREKAIKEFGEEMDQAEMNDFLTLIYYPQEKLQRLEQGSQLPESWYHQTLSRLIRFSRMLSSKYTREKVRSATPTEYAFVLDELLHAQPDEDDNQYLYHQKILDTLIGLNSADEFIAALCTLIKRLAVDKLHIVGDIFDRGPHSDRILDLLTNHHAVDIEWGNHDLLWMGAACGNLVCIAAAVKNSISYNNLEVLESGYGVSLRPLMLFAQRTYPELPLNEAAVQAINVMMFKLEGQLIARHPEYGMDDRRLLHRMDFERHTISLDSGVFETKPMSFPTVDPEHPYELTPEETEVMEGLRTAFRNSDRLERHMEFLYQKGRMYRVVNGNLLFHGCIPMTESGGFAKVEIAGAVYSGRCLMDHHDAIVRAARYEGLSSAVDFMWYLWCSPLSPVCGRHIKTFERAYVLDKSTWDEPMDPYYKHCESVEGCVKVLREFGLTSDDSHIINGHTPIKVRDGESPIKAEGKLVVIDGGFSRAFHKRTGIAGYTLIANSHGLRISAHQPFTSIEDVLEENADIHSDPQEFSVFAKRMMNADTDEGRVIQRRISMLEQLLAAYRAGWQGPGKLVGSYRM